MASEQTAAEWDFREGIEKGVCIARVSEVNQTATGVIRKIASRNAITEKVGNIKWSGVVEKMKI